MTCPMCRNIIESLDQPPRGEDEPDTAEAVARTMLTMYLDSVILNVRQGRPHQAVQRHFTPQEENIIQQQYDETYAIQMAIFKHQKAREAFFNFCNVFFLPTITIICTLTTLVQAFQYGTWSFIMFVGMILSHFLHHKIIEFRPSSSSRLPIRQFVNLNVQRAVQRLHSRLNQEQD